MTMQEICLFRKHLYAQILVCQDADEMNVTYLNPD